MLSSKYAYRLGEARLMILSSCLPLLCPRHPGIACRIIQLCHQTAKLYVASDVFRGCLQVKMKVDCNIVKDVLKGDEVTELRVKLLSIENEIYPYKDDD